MFSTESCTPTTSNQTLHFILSSFSFEESPRKYVENEVTIHYRTPVRREVKEVLDEEELAKKQANAMKKIYEEDRRRKYLQVSKSLQVS